MIVLIRMGGLFLADVLYLFWEYGCVNSQFIHYSVKPMHGEAFEFTFIYGFNDQASREELWSNLKRMSRESDKP